jgi:hypothetical protein
MKAGVDCVCGYPISLKTATPKSNPATRGRNRPAPARSTRTIAASSCHRRLLSNGKWRGSARFQPRSSVPNGFSSGLPEVAGYFEMDCSRLIIPAGTDEAPKLPEEKKPEKEPENGGGRPPSGLHRFIQGLLQTLPTPETEWSVQDRAKPLQTAANIFDLIYKGAAGRISVTAAHNDRSLRPQENE